MRRALLVLAIAGCGGDDPAPAPAPAVSLAGDLTDPGAGAGDEVVARVDGRPVWASCVTGHVRARRVTVDQALADCIDLELLAMEAARRDFHADPETVLALRTALVDGFVRKEFEAKYKSPADLPKEAIDQYVKRRAYELERPEIRSMAYARAEFPRGSLEGSEADLAARAFAAEIYAELGERQDLFMADLFATARRLANGRPLETAIPRPGLLDEVFGAAAYAVPGIGQISPPTRTRWGWDLILITDLIPGKQQTPEQLIAAEARQVVRWFFDHVWAKEMAATHVVKKFPAALEEPAGSGAPR